MLDLNLNKLEDLNYKEISIFNALVSLDIISNVNEIEKIN